MNVSGIDIGAVAEKYFSTLVVASAGCNVQWCAVVTVAGVGISMMSQEHLNTLPPVCSHIYTQSYTCVCTHSQSYTCMYAFAHTHTCTHAHTSQGYGTEEKVCEKRKF